MAGNARCSNLTAPDAGRPQSLIRFEATSSFNGSAAMFSPVINQCYALSSLGGNLGYGVPLMTANNYGFRFVPDSLINSTTAGQCLNVTGACSYPGCPNDQRGYPLKGDVAPVGDILFWINHGDSTFRCLLPQIKFGTCNQVISVFGSGGWSVRDGSPVGTLLGCSLGSQAQCESYVKAQASSLAPYTQNPVCVHMIVTTWLFLAPHGSLHCPKP